MILPPTSLAAVAAVALAACGGETVEPIPIPFGLLASRTGDLAAYGADIHRGALLAIAEINDAGGIRGRLLSLVMEDDGTTAVGARTAYSALLTERVVAVVGPGFSGGAFAIANALRSGHTLTISGSTTAPDLGQLDDDGYFFRTVPSDVVQGQVLADLIKEKGVQNLCIVHRDDPYGNGLAAALSDRLTDGTRTIVPTGYPITSTPSDAVLEACQPLVSAPQRGIVFVTFEGDGSVLMSRAITRGWRVSADSSVFLVDGNKASRLYMALPDQAAFEGALGTAPTGPEPESPAGQRLAAFRGRFETKYQRPAGVHTETNYDAVYLAAIALAAAGEDATQEEVRDAMAKTRSGRMLEAGDWSKISTEIAIEGTVDYLGASGDVDLDPTSGELTPPYYIGVWQLGRMGTITEKNTVVVGGATQ